MGPKGFFSMLACPCLPKEDDADKWSPDDARGCLAFIFWTTVFGAAIQTFAGMEGTARSDFDKQGVTGFLAGVAGIMFLCFLLGRYTIQYPARSKILGVLGYLATAAGFLSAFVGGPYSIYKLEKKLSVATLGYIIMMVQSYLWFKYGLFMQYFGAEESKTFDTYAAKIKKENEEKNKTGKEDVKSASWLVEQEEMYEVVKNAMDKAGDDEDTRGRPQHKIKGEQRKRTATPGGLPAKAS